MKKEIARRWIKALRSGRYRQGKKALKTRRGPAVQHCCLGVLCELYQQDKQSRGKKTLKTTEIDPRQNGLFIDSPGVRAVRFSATATDLPPSVAQWAGMSSLDGAYSKSHKRVFNLAALNDKGATFKEIADVIENKCDEL
jgi:hypothetical protein